MKTLILFLVDILLGYVPQAAGCAICLFAVTNQNLRSRKFWLTTGIFSAIAIVIRTAYNINLIDFGFHTIIIWSIFILVAIGYNKIPAMRSICSILLSGIFITATELITAGSMILIFGSENFTKMMNDTETMDGRIVKAICGIPANILFVIVVLVFYFIKAVLKRRKLQKEAQTIPENL
jgi:lysylphosphatidylglycerol synthetase-like protein (DUF2156 family)